MVENGISSSILKAHCNEFFNVWIARIVAEVFGDELNNLANVIFGDGVLIIHRATIAFDIVKANDYWLGNIVMQLSLYPE
ncbi:MAG: hypothetical protein ACJA2J_001055 [Candidatus Azotimanducaceae bacterium]